MYMYLLSGVAGMLVLQFLGSLNNAGMSQWSVIRIWVIN